MFPASVDATLETIGQRAGPMPEALRRAWASLLYYGHRHDRALALLNEFLAGEAPESSLFGRTAQVLAERGEQANAKATLDAGSRRHPESGRLFFLAGMMAERSGSAEAERYFKRSVEADPDLAAAWLRLARLARYLRSDTAGAITGCSRVLEIEAQGTPLAGEALDLLAEIASNRDARGRLPLLDALLTPILRHTPGLAAGEAPSLNAALLYHEGRRGEALDRYQHLAGLPEPRASVSARAAELLAAVGQADRARPTLDKAIAADPTNARLYDLAGRLSLQESDPSRARSFFERAVKANDDYAPAHLQLAELAEQAGDTEIGVMARCAKVLELEEPASAGAQAALRLLNAALARME